MKHFCHTDILTANGAGVLVSNYNLLWGPWDEFCNVSILQLLQLHPADHGQGVAGRGHAVSVLLGNSSYSNELTLDKEFGLLQIFYYVPKNRRRMMKSAWKNQILLRGFLCTNGPGRELFRCKNKSVLHLPLLHVVSKIRDEKGIRFLLAAQVTLAEIEMHCI
jgi:hypothetical protein